jgi:hypothetical protein
MVRKMKLEESEILRKQVEKALQAQEQAAAALRESEERFRLVAAEPKRDSLILQSQSRTTSYGSDRIMI